MDYYADIAVTILFFVMLGVSLNLLLGYAGEVSLAHATLYGIGAYTAGLLTLPAGVGITSRGVTSGLGWSIYPATAVAVVAAFVFAIVISLPAISRVRGEYLILLTLAFQLVANQLMNSLDTVTGGPYGLTPLPPLSAFGQTLLAPHQAVWLVLAATALVVALVWRLGASPFGRVLRGIREQEIAVRAMGKNTVVPKLAVFSIAAAIAGFAGALNGYYLQLIAPGTYDLDTSIFIVALVVLGGVGSIAGTIVGAVLLGLLRPVLHGIVGDNAIPWQAVIYGLALVLIMRFRPEGLIPESAGVGSLLRRARRRGAPRGGAGGRPAAAVSAARATADPALVARPAAVAAADDASAPVPTPAGGGVGVVERAPSPAPPGAQARGETARTVVELEGLSKRFGGLQAVADVSVALREHAITALIGPNGAGKTTIFNLMTGALALDSGRVRLHGQDVTGLAPYRIARLGMVRSFQDVRVCQRLSAADNVALAVPDQPGENVVLLGARPIAVRRRERAVRERAREALEFVGLHDRADELVGRMSFGDQKLVAIARLLATECDVLLLDEPTSGVDPGAVEHVIGVVRGLRDAGRTICLVEHSVHFVEQLADHTVFLDQGRVIAEGVLADLMAEEHLTRLYFGT